MSEDDKLCFINTMLSLYDNKLPMCVTEYFIHMFGKYINCNYLDSLVDKFKPIYRNVTFEFNLYVDLPGHEDSLSFQAVIINYDNDCLWFDTDIIFDLINGVSEIIPHDVTIRRNFDGCSLEKTNGILFSNF